MSKFCHSNLRHIRGEIREVVLEFQGLNRYEYFTQPSRPQELLWADEGILFVIPYTHPWSWMNEASVAYVNWLLDELFRLLALDSATPIVSTGFSMGGQEAIIYPMYAGRPVAAVMANSPVCDLKYHLTERDDLPRTILSAFIVHSEGFDRGVESRSPIHCIDRLKDIPYLIISGGMDDQVNQDIHARRLVALMRERCMRVVHCESPTMRHWAIDDSGILRRSLAFIAGGYTDVAPGAP